MSFPTPPNMPQDSAQRVHPIFAPSNFPADIDYQRAFYEAAVLATRLMNSPQALQHDYCFYFGKSVRAMKPELLRNSILPKDLPAQYACDKAIGELTTENIEDVKGLRLILAKNVQFELVDLEEGHMAQCCSGEDQNEFGGCNSIIKISRVLYDQCLQEYPTPAQTALARLEMATNLLHELAHAAQFLLFGADKPEDFRETSNVAEGGFEYISRIFGANPEVVLGHPEPTERAFWHIWQSQEWLGGCYHTAGIARRAWQLPGSMKDVSVDMKFVMKLFDEQFWTGEYVQRGALALIPDHIADVCRSFSRCITYKSVPLSIRDLFRSGGPSYAKRKYARFANPERNLRGLTERERLYGCPPEGFDENVGWLPSTKIDYKI